MKTVQPAPRAVRALAPPVAPFNSAAEITGSLDILNEELKTLDTTVDALFTRLQGARRSVPAAAPEDCPRSTQTAIGNIVEDAHRSVTAIRKRLEILCDEIAL